MGSLLNNDGTQKVALLQPPNFWMLNPQVPSTGQCGSLGSPHQAVEYGACSQASGARTG